MYIIINCVGTYCASKTVSKHLDRSQMFTLKKLYITLHMFMNINYIVLKISFITWPQMVIRNPSPTHNNFKVQNSDNNKHDKSFDTVQIQRCYFFLLNVTIHCFGKHLIQTLKKYLLSHYQ